MNLNFRRYDEGDEKSILNLFKKSFGKEMSYEYWKWRYADNPNINRNLINIALDNSKVVAHYALSPVNISINKMEYNAALSMTTMTDPDYCGRGLFTMLAQNLFDNENIDVVFGVPNKNSIKVFSEKLGFELLSNIPMLEAKVQSVKYNYSDKCGYVEKFDERFDKLFINSLKKYNIMSSRKYEHLNWRFVNNPDNKYDIICYIENNNVLGYIVTKVYRNKESSSGDIVDVLAKDEKVLGDLLSFAFSEFQSKKISTVFTWFCDESLNRVFEEFKFKKNGQYFNFLVKNNSSNEIEGLFEFNNWYITMSDIDLF